ncbi:hypothetical protein HGP17_09210 [Rhizobium sp. P38BS-XIX]|uniref:hypothetical protein n=1 Tax=Rhizobium sp. P38BS-XIX TaxID=2726740 RepID=UPI0014571B18|nr:hypothetical protein [Rhizobium sp. P38BS-XIX]NLR97013.1 hypothetical protein [Rhizobium sp. P38BS-XIX]
MQTAGYKITPQDTEIFRDLLSYLGEEVFDQRESNGVTAKSGRFLRKINDARRVLEKLQSKSNSGDER